MLMNIIRNIIALLGDNVLTYSNTLISRITKNIQNSVFVNIQDVKNKIPGQISETSR